MKGVPFYDERNSTTFKMYPSIYDLHYGSGSVYGHQVYDTVCLEKERGCAYNFGFLTAMKMELDPEPLPISGLIGLAPRDYVADSLFVEQLKKSKSIDQKVFSIFIDAIYDESKIMFGGYDLKKYADEDHQEFKYHDLTKKNITSMWFIEFEEMRVLPPDNDAVTEKNVAVYDDFKIEKN